MFVKVKSAMDLLLSSLPSCNWFSLSDQKFILFNICLSEFIITHSMKNSLLKVSLYGEL